MSDEEHIPQLLLERLAKGEMEGVERAYQERLDGLDPDVLDARLEALRAHDAHTLEAYPFEDVMARSAQAAPRHGMRRARARAAWFGGAATLAAAAALVFWAPSTPAEHATMGPEGPGEVVRIKGAEPKLLLFLKTGETSIPLERGAEVAQADVVQVRYVSGGKAHGVIVSLDGRGVVTLHHPSEPSASTALERGTTKLAHGYRLDDAPKYERFLMITADAPLDPSQVSQTLERDGATQATRSWEAKGYGVNEFMLKKVTR